ncbi:MAG: glycosyltransferase family 4 protein [Bacteroidota bacterium]
MILYPLILVVSFALTYLVRITAIKKSLIDIPNERSSHVIPTPRGGGLAIAITWFLGISYLHFFDKINPNLYYALMSGCLVSGISFIDDIYNLKSLPRLIVQAFAAAVALFFIGGMTKIDLGFYIIENRIILSIIAFVGIIWFINLFNFIDGIDGYAATEAVFVSLALFFFIGDSFLLILAMSVLGFLPWNWDKAKMFMGDIGSTLLGFSIIVIAIFYNNTGQFSIFNSLILSSLFWFDATFTLFRRFLNKEKLSEAHKKHAYQRIVQFGFSHQKTVIYAICANLLLFGIVFFSNSNNNYVLLFLTLCLLLLFGVNKSIDSKKPFNG